MLGVATYTCTCGTVFQAPLAARKHEPVDVTPYTVAPRGPSTLHTGTRHRAVRPAHFFGAFGGFPRAPPPSAAVELPFDEPTSLSPCFSRSAALPARCRAICASTWHWCYDSYSNMICPKDLPSSAKDAVKLAATALQPRSMSGEEEPIV